MIGEFKVFEHELPVLLAWSCSKPFSAPDSNVSICLASLCTEHKHLGMASFKKREKRTYMNTVSGYERNERRTKFFRFY